MNISKTIFGFLFWILLLSFGAAAVLLLLSNTGASSDFRSLLVQSESMSPAIKVGDVVIVRRYRDYSKNDVITFYDRDLRIVTHRVTDTFFEGGGVRLTTQGDANRSEDINTIALDQVIGKVVFIIPHAGFLVVFSKSLPGLITLVFVPAIILVLGELLKFRNG